MTDLLEGSQSLTEDSGRSKRARVKSQRALESEQTDRILARARAQQRAADGPVASGSGSPSSSIAPPPIKKSRAKTKKKDEPVLYCICKTDGEDGRPMIECGICQDW